MKIGQIRERVNELEILPVVHIRLLSVKISCQRGLSKCIRNWLKMPSLPGAFLEGSFLIASLSSAIISNLSSGKFNDAAFAI